MTKVGETTPDRSSTPTETHAATPTKLTGLHSSGELSKVAKKASHVGQSHLEDTPPNPDSAPKQPPVTENPSCSSSAMTVSTEALVSCRQSAVDISTHSCVIL